MSRKALANALSAAPSMWTLGNAGMGALQVSQYMFLTNSHRDYIPLFLMSALSLAEIGK